MIHYIVEPDGSSCFPVFAFVTQLVCLLLFITLGSFSASLHFLQLQVQLYVRSSVLAIAEGLTVCYPHKRIHTSKDLFSLHGTLIQENNFYLNSS